MKIDIVKDMKHFIQMIIMTNLVINTIVVPLQTAVPRLMEFLTKFHRVIYKKKLEYFNEKEGNKRE